MIRFAAKEFAVFVATSLVAALVILLFSRSAEGGLWDARAGGMVGAALAVTLPLVVLAAILVAAIALGLGALAARRPGSVIDRGLQGLAEIGAAIPHFWLGILLAILFSTVLRWLPAAGFMPWTVNPLAALSALILPALALAIPQGLGLTRLVRRALVEATSAGYVRAAQGRGLAPRDAFRLHALPNALRVVLAALGRQLGLLIAGSLIVENVFYLPGLGRLIFDAIGAHDLTLARTAILILALLLAGTMFLARLVQGWSDPRLAQGRAP